MSPTAPFATTLILLAACHAGLSLTSSSSPRASPGPTRAATASNPPGSNARRTDFPASGLDPMSGPMPSATSGPTPDAMSGPMSTATSEPTAGFAATGDGPAG